jgi:hypothetical protein
MDLGNRWAGFLKALPVPAVPRLDDTPDARLMDLCYKVEAIDTEGLVIETYEPICVPKFVP